MRDTFSPEAEAARGKMEHFSICSNAKNTASGCLSESKARTVPPCSLA